jgi:hypothetical protein
MQKLMLRNSAEPTCALSLQWVKASAAQCCSLLADAHLGRMSGDLIPQSAAPRSRLNKSRATIARFG